MAGVRKVTPVLVWDCSQQWSTHLIAAAAQKAAWAQHPIEHPPVTQHVAGCLKKLPAIANMEGNPSCNLTPVGPFHVQALTRCCL
jgi:hypothetical protein